MDPFAIYDRRELTSVHDPFLVLLEVDVQRRAFGTWRQRAPQLEAHLSPHRHSPEFKTLPGVPVQ